MIEAVVVLLPRLERERRAGRTRRAAGPRSSSSAVAGDRRPLPRLRPGRGRLRPEHDDAQLRALAHDRPRVPSRRRDRRHEARPRRERLALARARARPRPDRSLRRHPRGHDARPRRPRAAALRADARRRLPGRLERGRHADRRRRGSSSSPTRPARSPGRTPSTTRRTGRSTSPRSASTCSSARRTSSSGRTSGSRTAAASCSSRGARTRCAPPRRAARQSLRDRHAAVRAARRLRRRGRVHRVARLGGDRRAGSASSARGSSPGCRRTMRLHGLPTMDGRVPTFAFSVDGIAVGRGGGAARRARLRGLARQLLRARGDEAPRARGRRRRRARRLRPLQHRPRRSTGSSPSSRGWSERPAGMGARSPRSSSSRRRSGPGRRSSVPVPVDRAGRDGLRAARPGAVPARLAGDPRRADAVLLAARPGARRAPAERVRARHRLRRAPGAPGARDVARRGARVPVGALARLAWLGAGRGGAGGRGAGAHLLPG